MRGRGSAGEQAADRLAFVEPEGRDVDKTDDIRGEPTHRRSEFSPLHTCVTAKIAAGGIVNVP